MAWEQGWPGSKDGLGMVQQCATGSVPRLPRLAEAISPGGIGMPFEAEMLVGANSALPASVSEHVRNDPAQAKLAIMPAIMPTV